ncbi:hypothetical protein KSF_100140 [Reticulibacter mediterranei]|uniref:Uncharacterized protein n=2 Tax=Reticulibacter mediterranei TaxID=2778369 RepID=A0A8J3J394_9CHLR|nr:hypothetical protein KSF_100140 [Reticulibacter mediterranei]
METPLSTEIIQPRDFYDVLVTFKIPTGEHDWWLIRWGLIAAISLLAVCCFLATMTFEKISLFQLLLGSLAVPLVMGVYIFFPIAMANVFNQLWRTGTIGNYREDRSGEMTYQDLVTTLSRQTHSPWLDIVALLIVVLFWSYQLSPSLHHGETLLSNAHWTQLLLACLNTLIGYVALLCIVRLLLVAATINRVFHFFTINVFPLHPDGSGGLGALQQLLWISTVLLAGGLCFVISLSSRTTDHVYVLTLLLGYLILFPAMLAAWLALPHREMVRARNAHLQGLADAFDKTIEETETAEAAAIPTDAITQKTERLAALQKHYDQVKASFPTWPVAISFSKRLGLTLFLPLLTSFVPAVINMVTKILK